MMEKPSRSAASSARPELSQDQLETLEMDLHGVAGGTLRRKLLPVLQRKRLTVQRRLLTRQRQPRATSRNIPKEAQAIVKDCLLSSSSSPELSALLSNFDWDMLWASLAPLLTPESYRTGDLIEYPNAPAEAVDTYFILSGTFVSMPPAVARTHVAQLYLRRQAAPQSFDGAKAASTALAGMTLVTGPCVYGLEAAVSFAPHVNATLFAGPEDHAMPNVVDTLRISNRAVQDWLMQLARAAAPPQTTAPSPTAYASFRFGPPRQDCSSAAVTTPRRPSHAARRLSKFDDMMKARRCSAAFQDNGDAAPEAAVAAAAAREDMKKRDAALKRTKVKLLAFILATRERCVAQNFPLSEELLKLSWLFQTLPQHALGDVLKHIKPLSLAAGSTLAVAGESDRRWFFLRRGRCAILPNATLANKGLQLPQGTVQDVDKKRRSTFSASGVPVFVDAGCSIGELSLIFEEPRSHTIETTTTCDLWTLDQTVFSEILSSDETLRANCQRKGAVLRAKWLAAQRRAPALMEILQDCPLFHDCWSDVLYSLVIDALEPLVLPQRTLIASASEFADRMLVIVKGNASSQRGDVPIAFGTGSIVGGACFVRHRWPFAVAATSIVDAWMLSAEKLRWIAERMDIVQTLSSWEPEADRSKYLTKLQDMYPGGKLFPLETLALLRRSIQLGTKELISVLPKTKSSLCHKGERRTSFVAHFRNVSLRQLEELCVSYPNSFNMNDLLFRTSYGRAGDHLRTQFLAITRQNNEGGAITTSSSEEGGGGTPKRLKSVRFQGTASAPDGKTSPSAALQQQSASSHKRRQRRLAFERQHRRRIKHIVGEVLSPSEPSESDNGGDSDDGLGSPEDKLRKFRAHRRTHKRHGLGSAVLSHVDDGTVMNAAQLAADQVVMRRVLREQRKKERAALSMTNALVFNPAVVFNGQRTLSTGHGNSLMIVPSGSNSIALSDDDRCSVTGSAAGGTSEAAVLRALNKSFLPTGAHEWEVELRAIFAAGDDVIPTLRDMARLLRMRTKKVRQRIKAKSTIHSGSTGHGSPVKDGAYWADALLAPIPDESLHLWVHTTDPEVTVGIAEHRKKRHDIAVSAANRLGHYIMPKPSTHGTAGSGADDEDTASEKTKMLLQLFRSGYAGRTATTTTKLATTDGSGGDASLLSDGRSKRQPQLSFLTTGESGSNGPAVLSGGPSVVGPSGDAGTSSFALDGSTRTRTSPQTITLTIPDLPGGSDSTAKRASPVTSPIRDLLGKSVEGGGGSSRKGADLKAPQHFPTRALYFEYVARELALQASTQPIEMVDALQERFQCGWVDNVAAGDPALDVHVVFDAFVQELKHAKSISAGGSIADSSSSRRPSQAQSNSSSTALGSSHNALPDVADSRLSKPLSDTFATDSPVDPQLLGTPETPRSCSSPALSDICWSEWDGYLECGGSGETTTSNKAAAPSTWSSIRQGRSFTMKRRGTTVVTSDTSASMTLNNNSDSETNAAASGASVVKSGRGAATLQQRAGPFESQLFDGASWAREELLAYAEALRTGVSNPEQLEALLVAQADGADLDVWIDGIGAVAIGQRDDADAGTAVHESAEVATARKVLRFAAKRRDGGGPHGLSAAETTGREGGSGGGHFYDDASLTASYEALSHHRPGEGGIGAMRFPDSREAHQMIKRLERLADSLTISFGKSDQQRGSGGANDAFDPEKERRMLALAIDDIRSAAAAAAAAASPSGAATAAADIKVPQRYGRQKAVAVAAAATECERPFRTDERHSSLPWFFEKDAGPDFLAEALAQDEAANRPKPRSLDDDDMDDEEKEDESNERVVLVGSRQFNRIPRPLCRALPAFEDDGGDGGSAAAEGGTARGRLPKMAQLISFSAFADGDTLPPTTPVTIAGGSMAGGSIRGDTSAMLSMNSSGSRIGGGPIILDDESHDDATDRCALMGSERALVLKKKRIKSYARSTLLTHSAEECASHGPAARGGRSEPLDAFHRAQHLRRLDRVCKATALRRAHAQRAASDVIRALPMLPITPNMAVMLLPTDPNTPTAATTTDDASARRTVQWKSMVVPLR